MPLPTRKVVGQAVYGDNTGASGRLRFSPEFLVAYDGVVVLPGPVTVIAGNGGHFEVELATTDAEGYSPEGWVWQVEELWPGGRLFFFQLPTGDGSPLDYTELIPAETIAEPFAPHFHPEQIGPEGPQGPQGVQGPVGPVAPSYYGQMGRITSATVDITTAGTYQPTGLTGTLDPISTGIALGAVDGMALRNVSGETLRLLFFGSADVEASNNKVLGLKLALNGTPVDETECRSATAFGSSFAKLVTSWIIELADGEEVSMLVTNFTNTGNITIDRARLVAHNV